MTKKVVKYLKKTINMNLIFSQKITNCFLKKLLPYSLIAYINSNSAKKPKN